MGVREQCEGEDEGETEEKPGRDWGGRTKLGLVAARSPYFLVGE